MSTHNQQRRIKVSLFVFGGFALIATFFLIEEHRAHILGVLPYVLGMAGLLFCLFGHRHTGTWGTRDSDHGGSHESR